MGGFISQEVVVLPKPHIITQTTDKYICKLLLLSLILFKCSTKLEVLKNNQVFVPYNKCAS